MVAAKGSGLKTLCFVFPTHTVRPSVASSETLMGKEDTESHLER